MRKTITLTTLGKASLILAIALILCLLPLPYGFYTIVRLATAVIAGCWAYNFYKRRKTSLAIVSGAIALLFQPFLKIPGQRRNSVAELSEDDRQTVHEEWQI